ncbi:unnamed protein product [Lymnaea stagnalis]|uniref:Alpha-(1,6)-fucosyltransferase N- and catalytic domain-containing protein n=1 Tax=Lymnaea stagnalis TaxID=6523 RepID=A0AAV2H0Q2_LYMST
MLHTVYFRPGKFSSDVHKVTYCLAVAYVTRRTLRIKPLWWLAGCARRKTGDYVTWQHLLSGDVWRRRASYAGVLELSRGGFDILVNADEEHPSTLPDFFTNVIQPSFTERIREFHEEPEVWLVGQMADFILKPLKSKLSMNPRYGLKSHHVDLNKAREEMAFRHPIVGLYLHRTDNTSQSLASLMKHVISLGQEGQSFKTRVFVVTLDPDLFKMLQEIFPEYTFLQRKRSDKKDFLTQELYLDVYFLSRCDYLVCSFKWHMCRLAYELMQTARSDFSGRALELSQNWFFGGFRRP